MALTLNPTLLMKHLSILILCLLLCLPPAQAEWFSNTAAQHQEQIVALEGQLSAQGQSLGHWQAAAASLVIGCVLLLIIGTALGAQTRKYYARSRRMGSNPTPASTTPTLSVINGRKSSLVGEDLEKDHETSLAA
ncbi:MAG: hypothetical protein RL693_45 [Verrucomicrobiota bacterium]|jgi:hypothetical protein